jgi:hypothetical protein
MLGCSVLIIDMGSVKHSRGKNSMESNVYYFTFHSKKNNVLSLRT